jgi:N-acetyl sugar amidotransferase
MKQNQKNKNLSLMHKNNSYGICSRCVMDTSDPWITFDQNGECNHCSDYLKTRIKLINRDISDDQPLEELIEKIKSRGKKSKYDCVIGLSGGVDSSYVAYIAAKHKLRVFGVHMDNGWNSPTAVENIKKLVSKYNMGYASYVLPWADFRKVQLAFLQASVPEAETPTDIAIQKAITYYALKSKVPSILSGGNIASEGILPISWHYNSRDTKYSHNILKYSKCPVKLFQSQKNGVWDEFYCKIIKNIKTYYPLNYIPYDKDVAREELTQEVGWKYYGSKHGESRYTKFIQSYYLFVKHGIDYRRATLSSEICLGKISRNAALNILKKLPYENEEIQNDIEYVAKKLGISAQELYNIIKLPPKWYKDFKNNEFFLGKIYDAYRFLNGKEKSSNF